MARTNRRGASRQYSGPQWLTTPSGTDITLLLLCQIILNWRPNSWDSSARKVGLVKGNLKDIELGSRTYNHPFNWVTNMLEYGIPGTGFVSGGPSFRGVGSGVEVVSAEKAVTTVATPS